ncbi:hypothetical protein [Pedobacter sp.]
MEKSNKNKLATDQLLEKSKELREKSKATGDKFNALKVKLEEFIHPNTDTAKKENQ